ncbi:MAG: hypothetical protein ACXVJW_04080 [Acidimicrobiia bacterium]
MGDGAGKKGKGNGPKDRDIDDDFVMKLEVGGDFSVREEDLEKWRRRIELDQVTVVEENESKVVEETEDTPSDED